MEDPTLLGPNWCQPEAVGDSQGRWEGLPGCVWIVCVEWKGQNKLPFRNHDHGFRTVKYLPEYIN